jgi:Protein of unknown function (DUF2934)
MNTHEEIATLAYELWERRGHPLGSPEIDWRRCLSRILSSAWLYSKDCCQKPD